MRKFLATLAAAALSTALVVVPTAGALADQPDFICPSYAPNGTVKIDTVGNPATVPYTAPSGYLVDYYCVKAGNEDFIVNVTPPSQSIVIDHPTKDSVSHYSVHLIAAPTDVCANIDGVQTTVPQGMVQDGANCVTPPVDVCANIDGVQTTVPQGMVQDGANCVTPPTDVCANIDGVQTTVPQGMVQDGANCVTPPTDVCANIDGVQTTVPQGMVQDGANCVTPPTDVCANIDGVQTTVPQGMVQDGANCVTPPTDVCANIDGVQTTVPQGMVQEGEECVSSAEDIEVAVSAEPTDEQCSAFEDGAVDPGSISVTVLVGGVPVTLPSGVVTVSYKGPGAAGFTDLTSNSLTGLADGTYQFKVVVSGSDHELTTDATFDVEVGNQDAEDCALTTLGPVIPFAHSTNLTCAANGSYTIGNNETLPGDAAPAVTWTVNGVARAEGTYPVTSAGTIQLVATAVGPEYFFDLDTVTEFELKFTAPAACGQLETLALTGDDSMPTIALAGFLGLLGLTLLRSSRRIARVKS